MQLVFDLTVKWCWLFTIPYAPQSGVEQVLLILLIYTLTRTNQIGASLKPLKNKVFFYDFKIINLLVTYH